MIPKSGNRFSDKIHSQKPIGFLLSLIGPVRELSDSSRRASLRAYIVVALLYPDFSNLDVAPPDLDTLGIVLGTSIYLRQRLCVAAGDDRGPPHRSLLYPGHTGLRRWRRDLRCGLLPWPDPLTRGPCILKASSAPPSRNHDRGRGRRWLCYWLIAGRNAGAWRKAPRDPSLRICRCGPEPPWPFHACCRRLNRAHEPRRINHCAWTCARDRGRIRDPSRIRPPPRGAVL